LQEQRSMLEKPIMGMTGFTDPKDFGNSWSWNTGLMYHLLANLELMVGWQMDFSPTPNRTFSLDNASRDQNGLSLGARWQITDHWRAGLAYVHNWVSVINVQDSIGTPPTNAKGVAANNEFGFDVDYRF
jgi:long-subunit fatty acid transport protein